MNDKSIAKLSKTMMMALISRQWLLFKITERDKEKLEEKDTFKSLNMILYEDSEYHFREIFHKDSGMWVTGDCQDGTQPFRRSFPSLLDIGIMGHCPNGKAGICAKAGIQCYQNAPNSIRENMKLEDFKTIIDQCKGKTFQVALRRCR